MAINNLEQAAMTAASTGVTPTPTRVPQYEDRPGDEWMSYVPEAYGQLPDAIKRQRQREVSELESGIPEAIRQAAQPMSRRGLYGSGLQLEDIGQAALQRQIAIDKAKTLAEIDPLKAQIAMGDLAQQRGTQRAQESRRRYEKEESYSQQQKARDDLMKQAAGSGILSTLTGRNPISDFIFGPQTSVLEKALLASATGGKGLGTAGTSQQSGLSKLIASIGAKTGLDKLLGFGDDTLSKLGISQSEIPELQTAFEGTDDAGWVAGTGGATGLLSGLGITESEIPELQTAFEGTDFEGGWNVGTEGDGLFSDLGITESEIPGLQEAFEGVDYEPFGDTFDSASLGDSEVASQAARQPSLPFKNPLDNPNLTAMLGTDTSLDYSPTGFLPSEAEMLAGEGGSMYGGDFLSDVPFTDPTYGGFGEGVDLGTEGWDFIDDVGEGTNIFSEAGQAAGELVDKIPFKSTLGSLAIASALNPEGIKGIASNPLSFIGPQIMGAGKVGIGNIAGSLLKGQMPSFAGAAISPLAASVIGLPIALAGAGMAKAKKDRARDEAEEIRNRSGSARYNFVPGELWMAGNKRTSPVLDEANTNFRYIDELTNMDEIYEQDPRRSVVTSISNKSLSERGQDFAKEAEITYTNPDPDIQNTSQKWLGKQQVYSELIPELKPVFMAGLKGQMPREKVEDSIAKVSNRFFRENPQVRQLISVNDQIEQLTEANKAEGFEDVWDTIYELEGVRETLKSSVPSGWAEVVGYRPIDSGRLSDEERERIADEEVQE